MSYERLTERQNDGTVKYLGGDNDTLATAYEKLKYRLADLEEMLENNKLVYNPYKYGDRVFYANRHTLKITELEINRFRGYWDIDTKTFLFQYVAYPIENGSCRSFSDREVWFNTNNIGIIIFNTKEEAEERLKN